MPKDYILDTQTLDLVIENGDFKLAESTKQHQRLLLQAAPGDYKHSPLTGVGLAYYLLDEQSGNLNSAIRNTFVKDGMSVRSIGITKDGSLNIDASYE